MREDKRLDSEASGGCQCGAVRYRVTVMANTAHICHCRMCQKAVGNAFAALVAGQRDSLEWTRGMPARFESSDQVVRGFCADCGTPLFYDYHTGSKINLTIGSFDDPDQFAPQEQFGVEARLDWFGGITALPEAGPTEATMASIAPAIRASNHQHPDHDTIAWPGPGATTQRRILGEGRL